MKIKRPKQREGRVKIDREEKREKISPKVTGGKEAVPLNGKV